MCVAHEHEEIVTLAGDRLEFKFSLPQFLQSFNKDSNRGWAIVLSGDQSSERDLWLGYPASKSLSNILQTEHYLMLTDFKLCLRENLVIFRNFRMTFDFFSMSLPSTIIVFKGVLADFGLTLKDYSEKGMCASGIERKLGGFFSGMMILRDRGVRKLLQTLAENEGRFHLPRQELIRIVAKESQLIREREELTPVALVDSLIRKEILRPGLEFKCKHCYRNGWYDLSQFGNTFTCHYCFEEQPVPVLDEKKWRYRSSGLFGTKDVGYGSLAVICTSIFFRTRFMHNLRQVYSFEFIDRNEHSGEIDLAFMQMKFDGRTEMVFCECKTTKFTKDDFDKLEEVAKERLSNNSWN